MTTLRKCWLVMLLLVAGCDGSKPTGGTQAGNGLQTWQVSWDAVAGASGYVVSVSGKQFETVTTEIVIQARAGEVLECRATDGAITGSASSIKLKG